MIYFFYAIHVVVCVFLILAVLLQQGKGADLSVFGGGGTMTAFGARGAATLLHKATVSSFVAFIITTLAIGVLQSREGSVSVMSKVEAAAAAATDAASATEAEEATAEPSAALPEDDPASGEATSEPAVELEASGDADGETPPSGDPN